MRAIYEDFNKEPLKDYTPYLLLEDHDGEKSIFFGIYEEYKNSFFDGIGGHFDTDYEGLVGWKPVFEAKIEE